MELIDSINPGQMVGIIEIYESKDQGQTFEKVHEQQNMFVNGAYLNLLNLVTGIAAGYTIGHWAVGDGSSTAAKTATVIDGEYERFAIDNQYIEYTGGYYWLVNELNLASGEGNGTIRKVGLIGHGPTTTLANYNAADPDEAGHEWILNNYAGILMPNGKIKDASIVLKFIWKWRLG